MLSQAHQLACVDVFRWTITITPLYLAYLHVETHGYGGVGIDHIGLGSKWYEEIPSYNRQYHINRLYLLTWTDDTFTYSWCQKKVNAVKSILAF